MVKNVFNQLNDMDVIWVDHLINMGDSTFGQIPSLQTTLGFLEVYVIPLMLLKLFFGQASPILKILHFSMTLGVLKFRYLLNPLILIWIWILLL